MPRIITTIGPSSISNDVLAKLPSAGAESFRINLSHSNEESLKNYFDKIQSAGLIPSIDTQGAQLRVIGVDKKTSFNVGERIVVNFGMNSKGEASSQLASISLNHPEASEQTAKGDILKVDFGGLAILLESQLTDHQWSGSVVAAGSVLPNRAVDVRGKTLDLAILTEFDKYAIEFALARGSKEIFASFTSNKIQVDALREFTGHNAKIISKIESSLGVYNAKEIIEASDEVLIDRGDLSREIGISTVPIAVSGILKLSNKLGKPVNIATNILDSMMYAKTPSRAEISDIFTLLELGASGLVLAAEVAIGENPVSSTALVRYMIDIFDRYQSGLLGLGSTPKPCIEMIGPELMNWL